MPRLGIIECSAPAPMLRDLGEHSRCSSTYSTWLSGQGNKKKLSGNSLMPATATSCKTHPWQCSEVTLQRRNNGVQEEKRAS